MENEETEDERAERKARAMQEMESTGANTNEHVQVDYFGFDETFKVYLPDGVSYIEHSVLNEGSRRKYMNSVNREVRLQKSGDAFMKMAGGDERHALLEAAIVGWNLTRYDQRSGEYKNVRFNKQELQAFLDVAPPSVVDVIEKDIRDKNPWLTGDVTIEDIDEQMAELKELREKKVQEAEGNAS